MGFSLQGEFVCYSFDENNPMITRLLTICLIISFFISCKALTPAQAANGSFKKCRTVR